MASQPPHQPPDGGADDQPDAADPQPDHQPPSRSLSDELAELLTAVVLDGGVDDCPTDALRPMFVLDSVQDRASDSDDGALARAAREVIHQAVDALGQGPYGRAARLLFGTTEDSRGLSRPVRRDLAGGQVNVMGRWFARAYEPQIVQSVASAIYDLERPPSEPAATPADTTTAVVSVSDDDGTAGTDTATAIAPAGPDAAPQTDDETQTGDGRADGAEVKRRSRVGRVWRWVRPRIPDEQALTVLMAGPSSAHALTASQPKQLLHDLEQLRDQRARRQWYAFYVFLGFFILWRYGLDAVPRYILILAILGVGKTLTDMFLEWRATRTLGLRDRWPRILTLIVTMGIAGGIVTEQQDADAEMSSAEAAHRGQCVLGVVPREDCPDVFQLPAADVTDSGCPTEANGRHRIIELIDDLRRETVFTEIGVSDPVPIMQVPECIDPSSTYDAEIETFHGTFTIELDATAAPLTVNNFVFLSRWNYYDWTTVDFLEETHELRSRDLITGLGEPDAPGYEIPLEPPTIRPNEPTYPPYSVGLVNGNSYGRTSHGGRFFIVLPETDTSTMPNYHTRFGRVVDGINIINAITAFGGTTIQNITIDEQTQNDES